MNVIFEKVLYFYCRFSVKGLRNSGREDVSGGGDTIKLNIKQQQNQEPSNDVSGGRGDIINVTIVQQQ